MRISAKKESGEWNGVLRIIDCIPTSKVVVGRRKQTITSDVKRTPVGVVALCRRL